MIDLGKYINEVQSGLDRAVADVYRLEGALAILRKMQAENPPENEAEKTKRKKGRANNPPL